MFEERKEIVRMTLQIFRKILILANSFPPITCAAE